VITDVEVVDYQAIRKASLKLGRFTVITGPTGSGKSAVVRALRLVVFNARGTSYIRRGAKSCKAALGFREETTMVGIERGGRGADKYRLVTLDTSPHKHTSDPAVQEFTKLAGAVPAEVSALLRLGELNFSGQFDRPFLLDDTGSHVAKVLGDLTNVTVVFEAAREASRRKKATDADLRRAEQELEDLKAMGRPFRNLKERRAALTVAHEAVSRHTALTARAQRLSELGRQHALFARQLAVARRNSAALAVPSPAGMDSLRQSLSRLLGLQEALESESEKRRREQAIADHVGGAERQLHEALHVLLVSAGECPTCGQQVEK